MINCYIVDDEPNNVDSLRYILKNNHPELFVLGYQIDPSKAIAEINQLKPDLLFLDIQMPNKNGFELLIDISHKGFEVIFITAYDQYGIQAVKISALDYLLKPIDESELAKAIEKAETKINAKRKNSNLENLLRNFNDEKTDSKIALIIDKQTKYVPISEIVRCQADNNYTEVYLIDGRKVILSKTLKDFEEMLAGFGFLRCHHSHLVNIKYIQGIQGPGFNKILLNNDVLIPISRMKKELIKNTIPKYK
ncbi:LytR/AlgR family response regulator transcription factor [Sphingobacterium lactis]|uniref:Two-component system, LytT family, response regulator n=1 Tax=Sphingobacterium lactis TaxID=797291 RepID=A0A1H5ZVS6_9SPHI|nr:LytTR family DNA-binding domain-containing protein [Sphingobacterium lactis]SEG40608.1 two-component system, LytT family, response regulator [Sphingobacterium lactis]